MLRSLILASTSLLLAAQTPAPAPVPPPAPAPAAKPAPEAPKENKVLARIGKEVVRDSDFDAFLATMPEQQRMQLKFMPAVRDQYLKRFMDFKVMEAKARRDGMDKTPDFKQKKSLLEMQVLIQGLFERDGEALKEKAKVSDDEVKAYFDAHPDRFKTPETFDARHILVSTQAKGTDKALTDDEAKAKIAKIQGELKAGKSFADAAKEYSDDPGSKDKGGLYEKTAFGRFVPEFDKAVRAQEAGKVGEPVKTMYGYHLIQVEKITPAAPMTFEAAKDQARQQASTERQEQVMKDYLDGLKKELGYAEGDAPAAKAGAKKAGAKKAGK